MNFSMRKRRSSAYIHSHSGRLTRQLDLNGFSIVDGIVASVVIAVAVLLAVSGTGYIVSAIRSANERGNIDADMQNYAGLVKEKANLIHYCGSDYTIDVSACNGGSVGESNFYFHDTSLGGIFPMDSDCSDGTLKSKIKTELDKLSPPVTITRSLTVDDSLLVSVVMTPVNSGYPPRVVKVYPAVASFCPT
jgi:hypothetical protein